MAFKRKAVTGEVKGADDKAIPFFVPFILPHGVNKGETRPALVVKTNADGTVNVVVFTDAGDELPALWRFDNLKV